MTSTAFSLVQIRQAWRLYFAAILAERREVARRQPRRWG